MEIWKEITGYESVYNISNNGRVKRLAGSPQCYEDRILVPKVKPNGYHQVALSLNGEVKYKHIHRLVGLEFIHNPDNKPQINHKDCDKTNNKVSNLEWATQGENNRHARKNVVFKYSKQCGIDSPMSIQLAQCDLDGNILYVWENARLAEENYGVSCINNTNQTKPCKSIGFLWISISRDEYFEMKKIYTCIPDMYVDKRARDLSKARESRSFNLAKKYTKEILLAHGVKVLSENGNLYRKYWDPYAQKNDVLTYMATIKRFGTWPEFKRLVQIEYNEIMKKDRKSLDGHYDHIF